jgi:dihydrofolate synthase/folylpolyglutamate synthase
MALPLPPIVAELLAWTANPDQSPEARRTRIPQLLAPWLPWLATVPVIKIAGTNGKGSVSAMLSAVLHHDGRRPGLFTSPHLLRVHERFRIAECEVDTERLELHAAHVLTHAGALVAAGGDVLRPSFFEALLAIALDLFRDSGCDVVVCEAGVGGRRDATAVLPGTLGAITSIGHDHENVLGTGLAAIAADKAGIVAAGAELVLGPGIDHGLRAVIAAHAPGVTLIHAAGNAVRVATDGGDASDVVLTLDDDSLQVRLPLAGRFQRDNAATVVALVRVLAARGVLRDLRALRGLAHAWWPGRYDWRAGEPPLLLDAAHNPEGLHALADALDAQVPHAQRLLLFGISCNKDARACAAVLPRLAPRVLLLDGFNRAHDVGTLRDCVPDSVEVVAISDTPETLLERALHEAKSRQATLVVCGSIFLLGEVIAALQRRDHLPVSA